MLTGFIDVFVTCALAAGYSLAILLLIISVAFMVLLMVLVINKTINNITNACGGIKTLMEFRTWYRENKLNKKEGK